MIFVNPLLVKITEHARPSTGGLGSHVSVAVNTVERYVKVSK